MEDINFEFADKFGLERPKSPFRFNDLDFFKKVIEESQNFDNVKLFEFINNSIYKQMFLIFQNATIEHYENEKNYVIENRIAYYYTTGSKIYFVCDVELITIKSKTLIRNEKQPVSIPKNFIKQEHYYRNFGYENNPIPEKLDADSRYIIDPLDIDPNIIFVDGKEKTKYEIQKYIADTKTLESLVRIPDTLLITNFNGKNFISHTIQDSNRRSMNPYFFSGYIGALFELINLKIISSGCCFEDGTGFPSVEHTNGKAIDIVLSKTTQDNIKKGIKNPLNEDEINIVKAFKKFHFKDFITDALCKEQLNTLGISAGIKIRALSNHKDHFHFTKFDVDSIKKKKKIDKEKLEQFKEYIKRKSNS